MPPKSRPTDNKTRRTQFLPYVQPRHFHIVYLASPITITPVSSQLYDIDQYYSQPIIALPFPHALLIAIDLWASPSAGAPRAGIWCTGPVRTRVWVARSMCAVSGLSRRIDSVWKWTGQFDCFDLAIKEYCRKGEAEVELG